MTTDTDLTGALCASHPRPDLWHSSGNRRRDRELAADLCLDCPVFLRCRDLALSGPPPQRGPMGLVPSVVAGMTEVELVAARGEGPPPSVRRSRRSRAAAPCAECGRVKATYCRGRCQGCYLALRRRERAVSDVA